MSWRPIHSSHAIERVKLVLTFKGQVPSRLSRRMADTLLPKLNDLRMVGPSQVQSFGFQFGPGMAVPVPQAQSSDGWQFTRNATNGAPLEAVVCSEQTLTYETGEYKRWEVFKKRLTKIMDDMVSLASTSLDLESMMLEYVDRFVYEGPITSADASQLLRTAVGQIHPEAARGVSPWHLHSGWFESVAGGQVLINQNFDVQDGNQSGRLEPMRSLQLLTNASFRVPHHAVDFEHFYQSLDELHDYTNLYVRKALQPEHLASIGLDNGA